MRTPHYVALAFAALAAGLGWYLWNNAQQKEQIYETCRSLVMRFQGKDPDGVMALLSPEFTFTLNNRVVKHAELKLRALAIINEAQIQELDIRNIDITLAGDDARAIVQIEVKTQLLRIQPTRPWTLKLDLVRTPADPSGAERKWLISKGELVIKE
jgi:hypothetical protein